MISHSYPSFDTLIFINQNQLCVFYVIKCKMQFYMEKKGDLSIFGRIVVPTFHSI